MNTSAKKFESKFNSPWVCPKCNDKVTGQPALSKTDNKTLICSGCGFLEAMQDFENKRGRKSSMLEFINNARLIGIKKNIAYCECCDQPFDRQEEHCYCKECLKLLQIKERLKIKGFECRSCFGRGLVWNDKTGQDEPCEKCNTFIKKAKTQKTFLVRTVSK